MLLSPPTLLFLEFRGLDLLLTVFPRYKTQHYSNSRETYNPYSLLLESESIEERYYTYEGSLTTPPLSECVRWIVFDTPLKVSRSDYQKLRYVLDLYLIF